MLVNKDGELGFLDASNPESPTLLWREAIAGQIGSVAVSDGGRFVAYRSGITSDAYSYICVLSGVDGNPLCKLRELRDKTAGGPLAFKGNYLFDGMSFGFGGGKRDTKFIYLFDLSNLQVSQ